MFSSVQSLSHVQFFATPWTAARQASLTITNSPSRLRLISQVGDAIQSSYPLSSPSPPAFNLSQHQGHPIILSSVIPFSSCLQSFPASRSFPMSQFFESGGQNIGVSASASVLPVNIQDWFPLGWTGLISLKSKGLSRVFSNTTVQKHQFFGVQLSSQSNFHIQT